MVKDIATGIALTLLVFVVAVRVPVLGFFGALLMPMPTLFYRVKLGRQACIAIPGAGMIVVVAVAGRLSADVFFFIELIMLGFILGELIERRLSIERTVLTACTVLVGAIAGGLFLVSLNAGQGIPSLVSAYVDENLKVALDLYQTMGVPPESIQRISESLERIAHVLVRILPAMTVTTLLVVTWANLIMARGLLMRRGLPSPDFGRLTRWQAPERLVWATIGAGSMLLLPAQTIKLVGANVLMVLLTIYFFQGIAIVAYYFEHKGVPRPLRIFLYSLVAVQQLLLLLIIAMGFFDMWFNFRRLGTEDSR